MSLRTILIFAFITLQIAGGSVSFHLFKRTLDPEIEAQNAEMLFRSSDRIKSHLESLIINSKEQLASGLNRGFDKKETENAILSFLQTNKMLQMWVARRSGDNSDPIFAIASDGQKPSLDWLKDLKPPEQDLSLKRLSNGLNIVFKTEQILAGFVLDSTFFGTDRLLILGLPDGDELLSLQLTIPAQIREKIRDLLKQNPTFPWLERLDGTAQGQAPEVSITPMPSLSVALITSGNTSRLAQKWDSTQTIFLSALGVFIGLSILIATYFASKISYNLESLVTATKQIANGNFDAQTKTVGVSEIRSLSNAIAKMSHQLKESFALQAEKARIDNELKTAEAVQKALLPHETVTEGPVTIAGMNAMASECGGDLWGTWSDSQYTYIYILDATGHGVSSALICAAARAVMVAYEVVSSTDLVNLAGHLNHVVAKVGQETHSMTGILAKIHHKSGLMEFLNFSHPTPYILPTDTKSDDKKNFILLNSVDLPAIGRIENAVQPPETFQFEKGESIIFVTDGLFELANSRGQAIKDRDMIDLLANLKANGVHNPKNTLSEIKNTFVGNSTDKGLKDDITVICCRWN